VAEAPGAQGTEEGYVSALRFEQVTEQ